MSARGEREEREEREERKERKEESSETDQKYESRLLLVGTRLLQARGGSERPECA